MVRTLIVLCLLVPLHIASSARADWKGMQYTFMLSGMAPVADQVKLGGIILTMLMPESGRGLMIGYIGPTIILPKSLGTFSPQLMVKTTIAGSTAIGLSTNTRLLPHRLVSLMAELDLMLKTQSADIEFYGIQKIRFHPLKGLGLGMVAEETLDYVKLGGTIGYSMGTIAFELMTLTTMQDETSLRFVTSFQF